MRKTSILIVAALAAVVGHARPAAAVIINGSNGMNTAAPTGSLAGSGWSYEGRWGDGGGTVIGSHYVLTAEHLGGGIGGTFNYGGNSYTVTQIYDQAGTDLRILQTQQAFSSWASIYTGSNETNQTFADFGYGVTRGAAANDPTLPSRRDGWLWNGTSTAGNESWGTGSIYQTTTASVGPTTNAPVLQFNFTAPSTRGANATPATGDASALANRDSGGGLFINVGGTWELAGVNWATSYPYFRTATDAVNDTNRVSAALYSGTGYYQRGYDSTTGTYAALLASLSVAYASRVSAFSGWINTTIEQPVPSPATLSLLSIGLLILILPRKRKAS